jgi:hypothetical protein
MAPRHGLACESVVVTVTSWRYLTDTCPALSPAQELVVVVVVATSPKTSSSTTSFHSQEPADDSSPTTTRQLAPKAPATSHEPKSHANHPSHPIPAIENSREYSQGPREPSFF